MPSNEAVALYWDFENLHTSLLDQQQGFGSYRASCFRPQDEYRARSCHEFKYCESLLPVHGEESRLPMARGYAGVPPNTPLPDAPDAAGVPAPNDAAAAAAVDAAQAEELRLLLDRAAEAEKRRQEMTDRVCRAIELLSERRGEPWVQEAGLRPFIQRMDPTFHESNFGFDTFPDLLESLHDVIEMRRGEHDHEIRVAQRQPASSEA